MASLAHLRPFVPRQVLLRLGRPAGVSAVAIVLVVLALSGAAWALVGAATNPPTTATPAAPLARPGDLPRGDIPIIGDPIRDLTIWWSNRLSDASRAGLDSMRGRYLTPIDPLADEVITTLYGKILAITIPLLTLGGMISSRLLRGLTRGAPSCTALGDPAERLVNLLRGWECCRDVGRKHDDVAPFAEASCVLPTLTRTEVVLASHLGISFAHSLGVPVASRRERR